MTNSTAPHPFKSAFSKCLTNCGFPRSGALLLLLILACAPRATLGAEPVRHPDEDVNDQAVRVRAGLRPNGNLLFSGWGITPAGEQIPVSDLALKLVVAPDRKRLFAVHGGFNQHGLTILDISTASRRSFFL